MSNNDQASTGDTSATPTMNDNEHASTGDTSATPAISLTARQLQDIVAGAVAGAIAQVASAQPPTHAAARDPTTLTHRPDRPSIDINCNESRWAFFKNEWSLYKRRARLPVSSPEELRACCTEDLRLELFDYIGPNTIDTLSETQLLEHIRKIAVKGKNIAVHRHEFYAMAQAPGQPIQQFVAKLKSKAEHCHFQLNCSSNQCNQSNSYVMAMVGDQVTIGLYDKSIQGEILAKHSQLKTFESKFDLIQAMEDGNRAKEQLSSESSIAAQQPTVKYAQKSAQAKGCPGCGSTDHGPGTVKPRTHHCPAKHEQCNHCAIIGHRASVCRKLKASSKPTSHSKPNNNQSNIGASESNTKQTPSSWFFTTSEDEQEDRSFITQITTANKHAWRSAGRWSSTYQNHCAPYGVAC